MDVVANDRKRPIRNCRKAVPQPFREQNTLERRGLPGLAEPGAPEALYEGAGSRGRRHLRAEPSAVLDYRPSRRLVAPQCAESPTRIQAKLALEAYRPAEEKRPERRHLTEPSHDESVHRNLPKWDRKRMVRRADSTLAREYASSESTLEKVLGSKRRITTVRERRNNIPLANPGDKALAAAEYMPGFFTCKKPLIDIAPTSVTNGQYERDAVRTSNQFLSDSGSHVNFRPRFNYTERRAARVLADDLKAVEGLMLEDNGVWSGAESD